MFVNFFYMLRDEGIPVSPTSFLRLQKALGLGLIRSLEDFYIAARCLLVKSERYFDAYDQIFARAFRGVVEAEPTEDEITEVSRALLEEWLRNPAAMAGALGIPEDKIQEMTPEELLNYFRERLKEQTEAHSGGNYWIGTKGTSPVGHSGFHPGGMRIGGSSANKSAIKVALERRYRNYSQEGPITPSQIGEALKRLKHLVPSGPRDVVNIDKTIYSTMRNAGEIEIVFDRHLADRLKVKLLIDNGGWSMDPYIDLVQTLFNYARSQFKDLTIYYFPNTVYNRVWLDPTRHHKPELIEEFVRKDPETRLIFVGDASMAPYELMHADGALYVGQRETQASIDRLMFLAGIFRHSAWLNPQPEGDWTGTWSIGRIREIFPMFELSLDGLEKAVQHLRSRN